MKYRLQPTAHPHVVILALMCAAVSYELPIRAATTFFLSTQNTGSPAPGDIAVTGLAANSTGTLYVWVNSDVRLSGVSLDLVETGGGIKFTGLEVANPTGPPPRWAFLDGPQVVTDSSVTNIGAAALPGLSGDGVGPGSTAGNTALLASVPFMATGGGTVNLQMRIGSNGIADWDGNFAQVHFGRPTAPLINGDAFGMGGSVGSIQIGDPIPPVAMDVNLGDREQGSVISHTFTTSVGVPPITWGNLIASGTGPLVNAPSLTANGVFNWNSAGSPLGQYNFDVTATNGFGSDVGRLSLNLVGQAPEPPAVVDFVTGGDPGETIRHTFQTSAGDTPITWSNLVSIGPGAPANLPQLTADGMFSWNSTGSPANEYIFRVTATNSVGSDSGELIIGLGGEPFIPEPSTATLLGLAFVVAGAGAVRRSR